MLTRSDSSRSLTPQELEKEITLKGAIISPDIPTALLQTLDRAGKEDLIVCTGSLTVVAEARSCLAKMGWSA